jgi:hypothetical protein
MYLIAIHRNMMRFWSSTLSGIIMLILTAIISLTAQGTANFFNPDAASSTVRSSLAVLRAGVVLLLVANIAFLVILGLFHRRCSITGSLRQENNKQVKVLIFALYAAATLILTRNLFRTVQIFSSPHAAVWRTEAFFWVFDGAPSLICMLILHVLPTV